MLTLSVLFAYCAFALNDYRVRRRRDTNSANAPTNLAVSQSGSNIVVLWSPAANAAASSHEVLFYQKRKVVAKVITMSTGGVRIYGLKKGVYAVRVRAANMAGTSSVSSHKALRVK